MLIDKNSDAALFHNNKEISYERFDDGTVIINFETGRYYALNPCAELVWSALGRGTTVQKIVDDLSACFPDVSVNTISQDVVDLIATLAEERLVSFSPSTSPVGAEPAVPTAYALPRLDIFQDLSDLILIDPIHEVDEAAGWPVAQPAS